VPYVPLFALAFAMFTIGSAEFAIQGLLPEISADLGIGIPKAGLLITGYALGVATGGPIVAVVTAGLPRKTALLALLGIFIVGNLLCAFAPSYLALMEARIVASFCHGAFVGIGSVVAASLAPPDRRASAVALVWAGFAASNILGVPAGAALGQALGWRATFWAATLLGVGAAAALALKLPNSDEGRVAGLAAEFRALRRPQLLLTLALGLLITFGCLSTLAYIAPLLRETTGLPPSALPLYLLVFGVGGVVGMQVGGRFADRNLIYSIIGIFVVNVVIYLTLPFAFAIPAPTMVMMFVWGFASYFIAAPIQIRVVSVGREAPNLASTLLQSAFNLGNAIGPLIGSVALGAGLPYALLPLIGAAAAAVGVGVALLSAALDRHAVCEHVRKVVRVGPSGRNLTHRRHWTRLFRSR
jgi:MFS transporter, DHA1 family, inner membrane transport protein